MIDLRIVELASDPQLIPGIYNTCDQWCDYCVATERCLSFKIHRGRDTFEGRNPDTPKISASASSFASRNRRSVSR